MSSDSELASRHLHSIAGHIRSLGAAHDNGSIGDDELAERLETIAQAADAYGDYHGRQAGQQGNDRSRRIRQAVGGFLRGRRPTKREPVPVGG